MKRGAAGWNQEVSDEDGRRRFHGAFTGGFSAGYYNSVGSREGWQPAAFASSRSDRALQHRAQRAEDFMDADDDPLLGRRLETSARFDSLPARTKQQQPLRQQETLSESDRPRNAFEARVLGAAAMSLLDDFVVPANESVGAKLLNLMGWKEGHGIGPRVRRKRIEDKPATAATVADGGDRAPSQPQQADHDADEADVVYVPPRSTIDVSAFPKPKLDKYGAGFDPYANAPEFSRYKRHQASERAQKQQQRQVVTFADAMKATTGSYETVTGFGLSALEENDDLDVYGTAPMSEFDTVLGGSSLRLTSGKEEVKLLESVARESVSRERRPPKFGSDGRPALAGFEYAYAKEKPPKAVALRLDVPADFNPHHHFDDQVTGDATPASQLYQQHNFVVREQAPTPMMTAKQRAALLGESEEHDAPASSDPSQSASGSVFDLLGAEQKAKLFASAAQARALRGGRGDSHSTAPPAPAKERQPLIQGAAGNQFRANITASIAKRFVSASSSDQDQSSQADPAAATEAKKSYRSESAWTPTSLLCKRFHVKCITGAAPSMKSQAEEKRDLFDKELVPHIVEFAAERRGTQGAEVASHDPAAGSSSGSVVAAATSSGSSSSSRATSRFAKREDAKDEEELPPLPIEPKPAASLLKAIFEPSDESDVEEDDDTADDNDDESTTGSNDDESNEKVANGGRSAMDPVQSNSVTSHHAGRGVSERIASSVIHSKDRAVPVTSDASSLSSDSESDSGSEKKERGRSADAHSQRQQLPADSTRPDGDVPRGSAKESKKREKRDKSSKKKHKKEHKHRRRPSRHEVADASDSSAGESDTGGRKHRKEHKERKKSHKRKKSSSSRRSESPDRARSRKHRRR